MKKKAATVLECTWPVIVYLAVQAALVFIFQTIGIRARKSGLVFTPKDLNLLIMGISSVITSLLMLSHFRKNGGISREKKPDGCDTLISAMTGIGLFLLMSGILLYLRDLECIMEYEKMIEGIESGPLFLRLAVLVVLAPACEELVFRKGVMNEIKKHLPEHAAVFMQAAVFAFVHFSPVQSSYAFIAGLFLGANYEMTGSLITSFALHAAFNASNIIFSSSALSAVSSNAFVSVASGALMTAAFSLMMKKRHP